MNSAFTAIFMFMFFGIFFSVFGAIIVGVIYSVTQYKKDAKLYETWLTSSGYQPIQYAQNVAFSIDSMMEMLANASKIAAQQAAENQRFSESSFNKGSIQRGFRGVLKGAGNDFAFILQSESRGSGKSRRTYNRTIIAVDIPDTQLQMIVNSKINNDSSSGGNLQRYKKTQSYKLEGEFGDFFELIMPDTTQSETLSMLTPDSMLYIMVNFADWDIEISGNKLFLYTYRHLKTPEYDGVIAKLNKLLEEMRLRSTDVRREKLTNALVARTATDSSTHRRSLKKNAQYMAFAFVAGVIAVQFFDNPVMYALLGFMWLYLILKTAFDAIATALLRSKYNRVIRNYK